MPNEQPGEAPPAQADDLTVVQDGLSVEPGSPGGEISAVTVQEWDGESAPEGSADDGDGSEDDILESAPINASARGWGSGWPNCQSSRLSTVVVDGKVKLAVRREIAPLVAWLCAETVARGYKLRSGQCWGFACRAIRGSSTASNHSWGLAVDLNSLANPMGSRLVTDMPSWLPKLWTDHGFRWGGTYSGRKDAMHFEYMRTPSAAAATIAALGPPRGVGLSSTPAGAPAAPKAAASPAPPFPLPAGHFYGIDGSDPQCHTGHAPADQVGVRQFQARLVQRGWNLGPDGADGFFGPVTRDVVAAFQREKGLDDDALVGPKTWSAIWLAAITP